jgi:flagellar basal-body rod protein FlgC
MTAERLRMDVISNNLANINTTRTEEGGPFRRQVVLLSAKADGGVQAFGIVEDPRPHTMVYDPGHPDANPEGYVAMPNVNVVSEMVDMMTASRAYEANVTAFNAAKSMAAKALEIGKS